MTLNDKKEYMKYWIRIIDKSYRTIEGKVKYSDLTFLHGICMALKKTCKNENQKEEIEKIFNKFWDKEINENDGL